jgi:hypothetical protein
MCIIGEFGPLPHRAGATRRFPRGTLVEFWSYGVHCRPDATRAKQLRDVGLVTREHDIVVGHQ